MTRLRPTFPLTLIAFLLLAILSVSHPPLLGNSRYVNRLGIPLPPDAAPPEEQVLTMFTLDNPYMEWFKTSYKVASPAVFLVSEPLIRVDHNFDLLPAAAERWDVSPDGRTWTFRIRRGLVWSDGTPLNAHDYVYSFRRAADPNTGYDYGWYYLPIQNWDAVSARRKPLEALGVRALDDLTFQVTTDAPAPYLPALLIYSYVSPKRAITRYGDAWSTRPETSVSSGPFLLKEWSKGERIVLESNPAYRGPFRPYLERVIYKVYIVGVPPPVLAAYEGREIDSTDLTTQAEVARVYSDPQLRGQLNNYTDFMTYYLTMDTYRSVFKDKRVRQAFSHAIDRDALCNSALKHFGVPAYAMLPPGFPAASQERLASIQRYDPALARRRLAEAGYPNGRGFPVLEMWLRNEGTVPRTAAEAIQAMLKRVLNIQVEIRNIEAKAFMDALNTHRIVLTMVPYQYDYFDPSNLLGLWMSNGRHAWKNDEFDRTVQRANALIGNEKERMRLYQQAERLLVEDVGGVFLWHPRVNQVWRPYLISPALGVNRYGQRFWRTDKLQNISTTLYVRRKDHALIRASR
ncbi:MAG: peptide ABC transporter substrate-binding protein [Candidatus Latescibacteria bacterium]|nr:peptide ABC transporter substrate-binding protein [Candidatus Latescibacterota bacterium]